MERRNILSILVHPQRRPDPGQSTGEHKVSDEQSASLEGRLHDGCQSCGWVGHAEGFAKAGCQEGCDGFSAEGVHEFGGLVIQQEVGCYVGDGYVCGIIL